MSGGSRPSGGPAPRAGECWRIRPGRFGESDAAGVSGDGSIVIGTANGHIAAEALIRDGPHGMRSLREALVSDHGVGLGGAYLLSAVAISTDGRVILGDPVFGNWVATIPEPAGLAVLGVGGAFLIARRRWRHGPAVIEGPGHPIREDVCVHHAHR